MEPGSKVEGKSEAKGVRQLLGQRERLGASPAALVRIAKQPQSQGRIREANARRIRPIQERQRAVLLDVVEGHRLLQIHPSRGKLAKPVERTPQCPVGLYKIHGVLEALG